MSKVISFQSEANKRNIDLKEPPEVPEQEDLFAEPTLYEGDYIHEEDRVRILLNPVDDRVLLEIYDINTNEKYIEYDLDCYTMFLLTQAFGCMYQSLEGEYSI